MPVNRKYEQEDWEKEMEEAKKAEEAYKAKEDTQNAASSLKSAIPTPFPPPLPPPPHPIQTEINMINKSTERMNAFNKLIRQLNNVLCRINVNIDELKNNPNLGKSTRLDINKNKIVLLIAQIEENYYDYIQNTDFERGLEELKFKLIQFNDAIARKQLTGFDLLCDTSGQGDIGCSCAIMGGRRKRRQTRRAKSRNNTRKYLKKCMRKHKKHTCSSICLRKKRSTTRKSLNKRKSRN